MRYNETIYLYHPLRPVLDHSADYTYYGNSLPQPCPPPSNLSATAWEKKTDQKFLPGKVTMHSPAPRCDSLKVVGFKDFYGSQWLRARLCCRKISDSIFWLFCFTPRWLGRCNALPKEGPQEIYKGKYRNRQETKNFSFILSFIYLVNGLTNATSKDIAWCPKHQIVKTVLSVRRHYPKRGSQKTWVFISFHRLQIRHSKILLILARPLLIGYFTFYYFSFFWF